MKYLGLLLVFILGASSCRKKEATATHNTICSNNAMVHYIYPPIPDICEEWIGIDTLMYIPDSIPTAYRVDSLPVKICYTLTGTYSYCGFAALKHPVIAITSIERR